MLVETAERFLNFLDRGEALKYYLKLLENGDIYRERAGSAIHHGRRYFSELIGSVRYETFLSINIGKNRMTFHLDICNFVRVYMIRSNVRSDMSGSICVKIIQVYVMGWFTSKIRRVYLIFSI